MGAFANNVFNLLFWWLQKVANLIWSAVKSENGNGFSGWIGKNWILLTIVLCVVGGAVDLLVYIFRWQPIKVIKSFFRRRKQHVYIPDSITDDPGFEEETEETEYRSDGGYAEYEDYGEYEPEEADSVYAEEGRIPPATELYNVPDEPEDELGRWREPVRERQAYSVPVETTPAGYSVPIDSPYRRPAAEKQYMQHEPDDPKSNTQRSLEKLIRPRRRRINVSDLFGDPESEMKQFVPPETVIDHRDAYHAPVYPRNWNGNGDRRS